MITTRRHFNKRVVAGGAHRQVLNRVVDSCTLRPSPSMGPFSIILTGCQSSDYFSEFLLHNKEPIPFKLIFKFLNGYFVLWVL